MRRLTLFVVLLAVMAITDFALHTADAAPAGPLRLQRDGSFFIAGRSVRCGGVRNVLDANLPSEGAAGPGVLVINPRLISRMPQIVRLFVFNHECGHHTIGDSELRADCWAVDRGVSEGWLDKTGLAQVCRSFGNMPATSTHPSGKRRCQNLDQCYAKAVAKLKSKETVKEAVASPPLPQRPKKPAEPTLVSGPKLIGEGAAPAGGTFLPDTPSAYAPH